MKALSLSVEMFETNLAVLRLEIRFIRKSTKIYKNINELEDNMVLIFLKDNTEVGRFLYTTIQPIRNLR